MERKAPLLRGLALVAAASLAFTACGGGSDTGGDASKDGYDFDSEPAATNQSNESATDPVGERPAAEDLPANACELLDAEFLNEQLDAEAIVAFGEEDRFSDVDKDPSAYCMWTNGGSGLGVKLMVEDAKTAEVDDHSERAYNIDSEPVVETQDGPGTKAVLLVDKAFEDLGSDGVPYGFFFVEGDVAAFVSVSGLKITPEGLRTLADEIDARLTAGG